MPPPPPCAIVELRRYTLHPGRRDTLIDVFDHQLVVPQEAAGMTVMGQFRDLDRDDCFVWLRGFADMPTRARALADFYGGPHWLAHRDVANATMVDWSDVRLLRPSGPAGALALPMRGPLRKPGPARSLELHLWPVTPDAATVLAATFAETTVPSLEHAGWQVLGSYLTDPSPNTYPRLPVREDGWVFAWFAAGPADACVAAADLPPAVQEQLDGPPERLRLSPTSASLLHP